MLLYNRLRNSPRLPQSEAARNSDVLWDTVGCNLVFHVSAAQTSAVIERDNVRFLIILANNVQPAESGKTLRITL